MKPFPRIFAAIVMSTSIAVIGSGSALSAGGAPSVFTVSNVPYGDILNVRQWPKARAPIVGTMKNGDQGYVDTTDCWNSATGKRIPQSRVNFAKANTWCSVMGGNDGDLRGYVRTKFLQ
jgi:hypothetical protein